MTTELLTLILASLGVSTVVPMIVTFFLKRREHKEERSEKTDEAKVEDAGKLREELWRELKASNERNDTLSTRYGALLQEKAQSAGQLAAANDQIQALVQRLSTEGMRVADAEDRAKRDRSRCDQVESRYAFLVERHSELERDYARLSRGAATRKSDLEGVEEPPGKIEPYTGEERRRSKKEP